MRYYYDDDTWFELLGPFKKGIAKCKWSGLKSNTISQGDFDQALRMGYSLRESDNVKCILDRYEI